MMKPCCVGLLLVASVAVSGVARGEDAATMPAAGASAYYAWALTPTMGWNSWDCFGTAVTEEQTLANADYMQEHLLPHGWNLITVDIQWYEPNAKALNYRKGAVLEMDANGRLLPAANRFPSTAASRSFKPLADAIHRRGLRFGLHLLRGIPRQAVEQNTPILGTPYHAADIADKNDICRWNPDMYGVDMTKPGAQAYYDSVFAMLASWDLDFAKVDDLSRPYHRAEIEAIRKAIDHCGRPIVFSTSPGETPVADGEHVQAHANMWRISDDFWDSWKAMKEQFGRLDNWTPYRGPGHFPDADMLPVGNVRSWQPRNKGGWTHLTHDEQRTMLTLWSIAQSPLILGGNLPANDAFTLSLLTNDEVIAVDQHASHSHQVSRNGDLVVWASDVPGSADKYVALFNAREYPVDPSAPAPAATTRPNRRPPPATMPGEAAAVSVGLEELGLSGKVRVRDLWANQDLPEASERVTAMLLPHASALYRVSPVK